MESLSAHKKDTNARSVTHYVAIKGHDNSTVQLVDNREATIIQKKQIEAMTNYGSSTTIQKKENNTGLPDDLKFGIENLSGLDMSDTKVHYNSNKPAQLNAYAFAQGTDIHIAAGQEKHLPHEAWHVVQQKQGRVRPTLQMKSGVDINDDARLEKEADVMGSKSLNYTANSNKGKKTMATRRLDNQIFQPKWIKQDVSSHLKWDTPIEGYTWYYNPATDSIYYIASDTGRKSSEHPYLEWLKSGWLGLGNEEISGNKAEFRAESSIEKQQRRINQEHALVEGKGGPHDAISKGGFTPGDLMYGPIAERRPYLTSPAVEYPGRVKNPRHKIVNPYNAAWYPGDFKEKGASVHKEPRIWEQAEANSLEFAGKSKDPDYTLRSALGHLKTFRAYYNKPGEKDAYPIKDDSDEERQKGWRRGSKAGIRNTIKGDKHQIHFVLDGLNLKNVFDKTETQSKSVTSTELRFIYRNWQDSDFRKGVKFYKDNSLVPAPWEDRANYNQEELNALDGYTQEKQKRM